MKWAWGVAAVCLVALPCFALDVFVRQPHDGQVVFGPLEVRLEVLADAPIRDVVLRLDGADVARLTAEPFSATVDFGQENRARTLEIVATDTAGNSVTRTIITGRIEVHFELDLGLQQLYVTVQDDGQRVLGLPRTAFEVLDDRARQTLVTFEDGDAPFTTALLIDSSRSMRGSALRSALAGARAFVDGMDALDEAKVLVFSDRLQATTPFTADPGTIAARVEGVEASGGSAVYDHLYLALEQVARRQGRQVVILLSDGVDVESVLSLDDLAWKVRRTQALVYWIRPRDAMEGGGKFFSFWRGVEDYQRDLQALEELVVGSGGRIVPMDHIDQATEVLADILRELREQYVLGYYPTDDRDDGQWHTIRVRVDRPGVQVRSRGGYYDEAQ